MRADVVLIRLIFTAILVIAGYKLAPVNDDPWISAAAGALIAICIIVFELRIRRATLKTLIGAAVGSILGIIGAYLIGSLISRQESSALEAPMKTFLTLSLTFRSGQGRLSRSLRTGWYLQRQSNATRPENSRYVSDHRRSYRRRRRNRILNRFANHSAVHPA